MLMWINGQQDIPHYIMHTLYALHYAQYMRNTFAYTYVFSYINDTF